MRPSRSSRSTVDAIRPGTTGSYEAWRGEAWALTSPLGRARDVLTHDAQEARDLWNINLKPETEYPAGTWVAVHKTGRVLSGASQASLLDQIERGREYRPDSFFIEQVEQHPEPVQQAPFIPDTDFIAAGPESVSVSDVLTKQEIPTK